jgi:hypothetical protein
LLLQAPPAKNHVETRFSSDFEAPADFRTCFVDGTSAKVRELRALALKTQLCACFSTVEHEPLRSIIFRRNPDERKGELLTARSAADLTRVFHVLFLSEAVVEVLPSTCVFLLLSRSKSLVVRDIWE